MFCFWIQDINKISEINFEFVHFLVIAFFGTKIFGYPDIQVSKSSGSSSIVSCT